MWRSSSLMLLAIALRSSSLMLANAMWRSCSLMLANALRSALFMEARAAGGDSRPAGFGIGFGFGFGCSCGFGEAFLRSFCRSPRKMGARNVAA